MKNSILRKVIWVMTIFYMMGIFYMSSRPVEVSRQDSAWMMEKMGIASSVEEASDVNDSNMMRLQMMIRKQAHTVMYLILGGLIYLSVYGYVGKSIKTSFFTLALSVAYAASDEFHQIFTHRGASVADVIRDAKGSLMGIAIAFLIFFIIEHNDKLQVLVNKIYNLEVATNAKIDRNSSY